MECNGGVTQPDVRPDRGLAAILHPFLLLITPGLSIYQTFQVCMGKLVMHIARFKAMIKNIQSKKSISFKLFYIKESLI